MTAFRPGDLAVVTGDTDGWCHGIMPGTVVEIVSGTGSLGYVCRWAFARGIDPRVTWNVGEADLRSADAYDLNLVPTTRFRPGDLAQVVPGELYGADLEPGDLVEVREPGDAFVRVTTALGEPDRDPPLGWNSWLVDTDALRLVPADEQGDQQADALTVSEKWSDGLQRRRHLPACQIDGHARRCLTDTYGTVVAHESGPDDWAFNITGGEWANLLDLAEAIVSADREMRGRPDEERP